MTMFVVKRPVPGTTPEGRPRAVLRVTPRPAEMRSEVHDVRRVRSFSLPESEQTHCHSEAADLAAVKDLNERAQVPFLESSEVVEMTPDSV